VSSDKTRERVHVSRRAGLVGIAHALGVSPSTVSNAYNRPDQLSPALREQILETAAAVGYPGPNPLARNLRRGRTGAVGVVFSEPLPYPFDDPTAVAMLQGLAGRAADEQVALMFVPGSTDLAAHEESIRAAAVDGLILHSLHDDDTRLELALTRRLPTVIIDSPRLADVDFVGIDDRAAVATAARHLLDLGHRRLGVLSFRLTGHGHLGPVDPAAPGVTAGVGRGRIEGCAAAVTGAGLRWDEVPVQECPASTIEAGRLGTHELLDRAGDVTAMVAFSDLLAVGAVRAAAERGLTIPGDLSIVGFDDTAAADEGITTVYQSEHDKGRIAAELLLGALTGRDGEPQHHVLPTRLVVRDSTGPAPDR
jgi:DNA-binding LacI/PurR family transcriptional regulator